MDEVEFRVRLKIEGSVLDVWVHQGWVVPRSLEGRRHFRDADVARGQLILDMIDQMGVNDAGVDVAMGLLDQVHSLRRAMRDLVDTLNAEDAEVKRRILTKMDALDE